MTLSIDGGEDREIKQAPVAVAAVGRSASVGPGSPRSQSSFDKIRGAQRRRQSPAATAALGTGRGIR